jgi:hypothetical protein
LLRGRDEIPREERWRRRQRAWNTRTICNQILGRELTDRALEVVTRGRFEDATRKRIPSRKKGRYAGPCARRDRPLVTWLDAKDERAEADSLVRRSMALLLVICEQIHLYGDNAGQACNADLWLGQQRQRIGDVWIYKPGADQGGLAARLGCDVRTLERTIAVLVAGRVLKAWQPPAADAAKLPKHMCGETYPYQIYRLIGGVPDCLAAHLRRWDEIARAKAAKAGRSKSEPAAAAPLERDTSGDEFARAVADAMADETLAVMSFVRGLKPS